MKANGTLNRKKCLTTSASTQIQWFAVSAVSNTILFVTETNPQRLKTWAC